jgi:CheY-like chemotaxis protein
MPGKILLIEDEPSNSRLIEVTLRPLGLETVIRADGISGVEAARDPAIAVIVLDIAIPKLDGWQVLDAIRNDPAIMATPVLVLTTHIGDEHVSRAAAGGADIFMTKPFQPDDLRQAVRALLQQHHQEPANQPGLSPQPLTR